jgi:hypothetical protein
VHRYPLHAGAIAATIRVWWQYRICRTCPGRGCSTSLGRYCSCGLLRKHRFEPRRSQSG